MIRLDLPKEPYWITVVPGAEVRVRPLTTAIYQAAKAKAARDARTLLENYDSVVDAGGVISGLPDLSDDDMRDGQAEMILVEALARYAIIEWTGVGLDDDTPAPVSEATIRAFAAIPLVAEGFFRAYLRPLIAKDAEGNASGPSPNGTSAAGPNTAPTVAANAKGGRAKTVPTKSVRRKASKARRRGAC